MFQGKMKAITFSYDDGSTQDIRLIALMNKYGLKSTFNLNSGLLGKPGELNLDGKMISHNRISSDEIADVYHGHEIAAHTLTHSRLTILSKEEIIKEVEEDRKNLEALVGYPIVGLAYPGGGINCDERVANIIRNNTPIRYCRTTGQSNSFDLQNNLYQFVPSIPHVKSKEQLMMLGERFLALTTDKPQIFYIWGHSLN